MYIWKVKRVSLLGSNIWYLRYSPYQPAKIWDEILLRASLFTFCSPFCAAYQ